VGAARHKKAECHESSRGRGTQKKKAVKERRPARLSTSARRGEKIPPSEAIHVIQEKSSAEKKRGIVYYIVTESSSSPKGSGRPSLRERLTLCRDNDIRHALEKEYIAKPKEGRNSTSASTDDHPCREEHHIGKKLAQQEQGTVK